MEDGREFQGWGSLVRQTIATVLALFGAILLANGPLPQMSMVTWLTVVIALYAVAIVILTYPLWIQRFKRR